MATYTKVLLSESSNGAGIAVSATASPGTLLHTATSTQGSLDEIWLFAANTSDEDVKLTIEFGGSSSLIEQTIPYEAGLFLVIPGLVLGNGATVRAFAGSSGAILIFGYVNRIAQ